MSRPTAGFTVHHNLRRKLGRSVALLWQREGRQSGRANGGADGRGRYRIGAQAPQCPSRAHRLLQGAGLQATVEKPLNARLSERGQAARSVKSSMPASEPHRGRAEPQGWHKAPLRGRRGRKDGGNVLVEATAGEAFVNAGPMGRTAGSAGGNLERQLERLGVRWKSSCRSRTRRWRWDCGP